MYSPCASFLLLGVRGVDLHTLEPPPRGEAAAALLLTRGELMALLVRRTLGGLVEFMRGMLDLV